MGSGFIQVHRKMQSSLVFQDPYYLKLWMWLLFRARYQPGEVMIGNQIIFLEIGQLVWGRQSASQELNEGLRGKNKRSVSTWESYLKNLEKMGKVHRKANNKFTVITIRNYGFYQFLETETQLQVQPQANHKLTSKQLQTNTKNKENKENKENKANKAMTQHKYKASQRKAESPKELPVVPLYNWLHPDEH